MSSWPVQSFGGGAQGSGKYSPTGNQTIDGTYIWMFVHCNGEVEAADSIAVMSVFSFKFIHGALYL